MTLKKTVFSPFLSAFTLLELIMVLVMLSLLVTLAVPSFRAMIQNNQSLALTHSLVSALNIARSEAIKRSVSVSVCAASDASFTACGNNWNNGWLIFTNPNEDNAFTSSTEVLLKTEQVIGSTVSIITTPAIGIATYQATGFPLSTSNNLVFTITAVGCTGNNGNTITISTTGRILRQAIAC